MTLERIAPRPDSDEYKIIHLRNVNAQLERKVEQLKAEMAELCDAITRECPVDLINRIMRLTLVYREARLAAASEKP